MYALTASSVCMGRASSCGRRRNNPKSATTRNAVQRVHGERRMEFSIAGGLSWDGSTGGSALMGSMHRIAALSEMVRPLRHTGHSGCRLAPHFCFNVVVQFVGRVPVAVEADIAPLHALSSEE